MIDNALFAITCGRCFFSWTNKDVPEHTGMEGTKGAQRSIAAAKTLNAEQRKDE